MKQFNHTLTLVIIALLVVKVIDFSHLSVLDIIIFILFFINIILSIKGGGNK